MKGIEKKSAFSLSLVHEELCLLLCEINNYLQLLTNYWIRVNSLHSYESWNSTDKNGATILPGNRIYCKYFYYLNRSWMKINHLTSSRDWWLEQKKFYSLNLTKKISSHGNEFLVLCVWNKFFYSWPKVKHWWNFCSFWYSIKFWILKKEVFSNKKFKLEYCKRCLLKIYALILMNSFSNWELTFLVNNSESKWITQEEFTMLPTVKKEITSIARRRVLKMKQDGTLSLCGEWFCLLHVIFYLISYCRGNSGSEDKGHPLFPLPAAELCVVNTDSLAGALLRALLPPTICPTPAQGSDPGSPQPAALSACSKAELGTPRLLQRSSSNSMHIISGEHGNIRESEAW